MPGGTGVFTRLAEDSQVVDELEVAQGRELDGPRKQGPGDTRVALDEVTQAEIVYDVSGQAFA